MESYKNLNLYTLFFLSFVTNTFALDCEYLKFLTEKKFKKTDNIIGDSVAAYRDYSKKDFFKVPSDVNYKYIKNDLLDDVYDCQKDFLFLQSGNPNILMDKCRGISNINKCLQGVEINDKKRKLFFDFISGIEGHLMSKHSKEDLIKFLQLSSGLASEKVKECQKFFTQNLQYINSSFNKTGAVFYPNNISVKNEWSYQIYAQICSNDNYESKILCLKDIASSGKFHLSSLNDRNSLVETCDEYDPYLGTDLRKCLKESKPIPTEEMAKKRMVEYDAKVKEIKEKHPENWENVLFDQDFFNKGNDFKGERKRSERGIIKGCISKLNKQIEMNSKPTSEKIISPSSNAPR